jgi:enoyl-CoA hydratase
MALAACADVIVAAEGVRFGIPEIRVGVIGASGFLSLLAPEKVVRYLALTGNSVTAEEVRAWGGVHAVVHGDDVLDNALSIAREISQRGPTAVRYFKQAMNINFDARLAEKYATEMSFTGRYVGTEESLESIAAFLENRPPRYD